MFNLFISPRFSTVDKGFHGGIRRVIDAQVDYFNELEDFNVVDKVEDADIVAIHAGSIVNLRADQTVIAHCHGLYWNKYDWDGGHHDINRLVIEAMRLSDVITAPTEWVAESIRRGMNRECFVVGHAVDSQWQPGDVNKNYVLWNKSRIDKVCDPSAVYSLAKMLPNIKFSMTVGHAYHPNITITGITPYSDISPVQEAGCYLATAQETFGIGILEALACGVPVVGWNWGGQAELIDHKVTGWLAEVGDYESLAEGIAWALDNHDALSADCVAAARRYTWETACKRYEIIYRSAVFKRLRYNKKVSVIIRNYNTGKYLPDAVNSVWEQIDHNDEIIVLDDCSTDDSKQIFDTLAKWPDKATPDKFKWVQTPRNLYLAGAQNYGINASSGEYIVLLDADNMLAPNAIRIMKHALDNDRGIDIAYGRLKVVHDDGVTPDVNASGTRSGISFWPPKDFRLDRQLAHKNQIPCTSMMRRKVYDVTGPYRQRCKVAEDADFWCRATSLGFVPKLVTDAVTLVYRNRPGTTSQQVKEWPWEQWYDWRASPPYAAVGNLKPNVFTFEPCLITVVIPVGPGHQLTVLDALDSLYIQTFKNWKCLIINDTGSAIAGLPPWVEEVKTPGSLGVAVARNIGLNFTKTKLWMPLDADDYLEINALERMLKAYVKYGGYVYSDWKKVETQEVVKVPRTSCEQIGNTMPHIITGVYPVCDVRFDESLDLFEDWDFVIQMIKAGHCGIGVNEPLVYYRQTSGTRRVRDSEEHRITLEKKWGNLNMAGCGTCGGRRSVASQGQQSVNQTQLMLAAASGYDPNNMTQIQYLGPEQKRYFTGAVTGQPYSFGTLPQHRVKYVWNDDVEGFVSTGRWQLYAGELAPV
jgi:glycosyltransferase involved in cell wall biosynthesis